MSGNHNQFQKPKSYLDDMDEVRKVLEMALMALEDANDMLSNDCSVEDVYADEIEALTKVLDKESFECPRCGHCCQAEQSAQQGPVAWANSLDFDDDDIEIISAKNKGKLGTGNCDIPLYTAPPKKEWVGLTDEERRDIREWQEIQKELGPVWAPMMLYLYVAIEAKLKEKNA